MSLITKALGKITRKLSGRGLGKYIVLSKAYSFMFSTAAPKTAESANINGMTMHLPAPSSNMSRMIAFTGEWEPVETRLFRKCIKPGMTFADCGANVGYYSMLASKLVGKHGKVISFEPSPTVYDILICNITENELENVTPHNIAIIDKHQQITLHIDETRPGYDSIVNMGTSKAILVQGEPLDYYFGNKHPVDFIKMDIQGAEYLALQGMIKTINHNPNLRMIVEYAPEWLYKAKADPNTFIQQLATYFEIWVIRGIKLEPLYLLGSDDNVNLFCVRRP